MSETASSPCGGLKDLAAVCSQKIHDHGADKPFVFDDKNDRLIGSSMIHPGLDWLEVLRSA